MGLVIATLVASNHLYDRHEWSFIAAVLLIYETAIALGSLGLPDAVFYFLGRYPDRSGATVRQTSAILLALAAPVIVLACGAGAIMHAADPGLRLLESLPWLAFVLIVELPTQPAVNQLIAHGRTGAASALYVGFSVLRMIAVLAPASVGWSAHAIPVAMAVLGLSRLAAHLVIVRQVYPMRAGASWRHRSQIVEIAKFAVPAGVSATLGKLNALVDKYIVELMLGAAAFGTYTVAAFELPLITLIPYAIGAVTQVTYVRLYAAGELRALEQLWLRTTERIAAIVVPLAMAVIVMARDVILLLFADEYAGATGPFQIFTAIVLHRIAAYGPMLQATDQSRMLLVTGALTIGTNLLLAAPLTLAFGLIGPALATAISVIPGWLVTLHRIGRVFGGGIRDALPWRHYGKVLAISAGLGMLLWTVRPLLQFHPGVNLALGLGGYALAYRAVYPLVRPRVVPDLAA